MLLPFGLVFSGTLPYCFLHGFYVRDGFIAKMFLPAANSFIRWGFHLLKTVILFFYIPLSACSVDDDQSTCDGPMLYVG